MSKLLEDYKSKFCDCSERTLKLTQELVEARADRARARADRDEARAELLSIAQQLELEREASAQLRAELGERMRETAEAQREACSDEVYSCKNAQWLAEVAKVVRATPLVTDTKASGGTT